VVDGTPGPFLPDASGPTFSPDSRRFAYAATLASGMAVIDDGNPGPTYDQVGPPLFSGDAARLLYPVSRRKRWSVVVDGVPGPEFADLWGMPTFSPDGRRVGYQAKVSGCGLLGGLRHRMVAVIDGQVVGDWDELGSDVHWSPDSAHVAFSARQGRAWTIVVDGQPGPSFQQVGPPLDRRRSAGPRRSRRRPGERGGRRDARTVGGRPVRTPPGQAVRIEPGRSTPRLGRQVRPRLAPGGR